MARETIQQGGKDGSAKADTGRTANRRTARSSSVSQIDCFHGFTPCHDCLSSSRVGGKRRRTQLIACCGLSEEPSAQGLDALDSVGCVRAARTAVTTCVRGAFVMQRCVTTRPLAARNSCTRHQQVGTSRRRPARRRRSPSPPPRRRGAALSSSPRDLPDAQELLCLRVDRELPVKGNPPCACDKPVAERDKRDVAVIHRKDMRRPPACAACAASSPS